MLQLCIFRITVAVRYSRPRGLFLTPCQRQRLAPEVPGGLLTGQARPRGTQQAHGGATDPAPPGQEQVFTADFLRGCLFRRNENPHERDHFTLLGPSQGLSSGTRYIVAVSHL